MGDKMQSFFQKMKQTLIMVVINFFTTIIAVFSFKGVTTVNTILFLT